MVHVVIMNKYVGSFPKNYRLSKHLRSQIRSNIASQHFVISADGLKWYFGVRERTQALPFSKKLLHTALIPLAQTVVKTSQQINISTSVTMHLT